MRPELKAIVASGGLRAAAGDPVFSHVGERGGWSVGSFVTGMGPALAREATRRALSTGPVDHVMVVGIAGGLDPALTVGSLQVPARVHLYPDGPEDRPHPLPGRPAGGGLMTTTRLLHHHHPSQPTPQPRLPPLG